MIHVLPSDCLSASNLPAQCVATRCGKYKHEDCNQQRPNNLLILTFIIIFFHYFSIRKGSTIHGVVVTGEGRGGRSVKFYDVLEVIDHCIHIHLKNSGLYIYVCV